MTQATFIITLHRPASFDNTSQGREPSWRRRPAGSLCTPPGDGRRLTAPGAFCFAPEASSLSGLHALAVHEVLRLHQRLPPQWERSIILEIV
jgi:hypothetical protein